MADDAAHRPRRHRSGVLQPGGRGHAAVVGRGRAGEPGVRRLPDGDAGRGGRRCRAGRCHGGRDRARLGTGGGRRGLRGRRVDAGVPRRRSHTAAGARRRHARRSARGLAGVRRTAVAVGHRRPVLHRERGRGRGRRRLRPPGRPGPSGRGRSLGPGARLLRGGHRRGRPADDPLEAAPPPARRHPVRLPARPALRRAGRTGADRRALCGDVPDRRDAGGVRRLLDDRATPQRMYLLLSANM